MSLNDPFGRVSRRNQAAYREFSRQLHAQGIVTPDAIDQTRRRLAHTSLQLTAITTALALGAGLLLPELRVVLAVLLVLVLLWLGSSYLQTRGHLAHYRRELAGRNADNAETGDTPTKTEENER